MPMSKHGDRYDPLSGTYLDNFRDGASYRGIDEKKVVYNIAKKVERILKYLEPNGENYKFYRILRRYTNIEPKRINIITYMSRGKSISDKEASKKEDPNSEFRLFDFPGPRGSVSKGRLSKINSLKPHLVVSLHLATRGPREYRGMNPVLVAPYRVLSQGLYYLKGKKKNRRNIDNIIIDNWFCESTKRSNFHWFLSDTSLYFTGFPLNRNLTMKKVFKGYRYNMVTWNYKDYDGWQYRAVRHPPYSSYSRHYETFVPAGKFWKREASKYESFRRDGGPEGYGGDNAYASYEIIRYILYTLKMKGDHHRTQKAGKSYVNVWILPLHINAINAFIELGYLNRRRDRYLLTKKQDEIAQGIAVGIYSLFSGLTLKDKDFKYKPKGKRIDLKKYSVSNNKSYFDIVTD